MTRENFTAIAVILDKSGSMSHLRDDTIGGFNTFLQEQQAVPGEAALTLCVFSDDYRLVHDFVKLDGIEKLTRKTYSPGGNTALLDAIGTTIDSLGARLASMPEEERPSRVLVMVITDGQENHSHRYTKAQIKQMVEHQQSVYNWTFAFSGTTLDQISDAVSMGYHQGSTLSYAPTAAGTRQLYATMSNSTSSLRSAKSSMPITDFFQQPAVDNTVPTTIAPVDPPDTNKTPDTK